MAEIVRPLEPGDAGQVAALEAEARASLAEQRGGAAHLREVPAVVDWSNVPTTWVATFDDAVVGYLQLVERADVAAVRQVYVHPEARELGFGDWLLEAALEHARAAGCAFIEGVALPGDRNTKNLYERAGITARKIVVSKPL
jgi:GNAT superfamily N-acetyltransferase